MPKLRHSHGRGLLLDDAEANHNTYIDRTSSASDSAKLRDCKLMHNSHARDKCQIYGGTFYNSEIWSGTVVAGNPTIHHSTLNCSEVSGSAYLEEVFAWGNTEICDSPRLLGDATLGQLQLRDAVIYGSPQISGSFEVTGRVHEGTWTRPPKHIKLLWCDLSECVIKNGEQHVLLECRCRSVSYWVRHGAKLARRWNWTEEQIQITIDTIQKAFYNPQHGNIPLPVHASQPEAERSLDPYC